MRDIIAQQLVEQAARHLRPADTKVFVSLAGHWGEFISGEELAKEIWPDRDWSSSRNPLQLAVHQLRLRLGAEVIQTRGSIDTRSASYAINVAALETFVLAKQFSHPPGPKLNATSQLASTLDLATKTGKLIDLFLWGNGTASALLDLTEKVWESINNPYGCRIRFCISADAWKKAVQLVSKIEAASQLPIDELCRRCQARFAIFITGPMLGTGQIKGFDDEGLSAAEIFLNDNQLLRLDLKMAMAFAQDLKSRWTYAEGAGGTGLITCDVKDQESRLCMDLICPYYTELTRGATATPSLLVGKTR